MQKDRFSNVLVGACFGFILGFVISFSLFIKLSTNDDSKKYSENNDGSEMCSEIDEDEAQIISLNNFQNTEIFYNKQENFVCGVIDDNYESEVTGLVFDFFQSKDYNWLIFEDDAMSFQYIDYDKKFSKIFSKLESGTLVKVKYTDKVKRKYSTGVMSNYRKIEDIIIIK